MSLDNEDIIVNKISEGPLIPEVIREARLVPRAFQIGKDYAIASVTLCWDGSLSTGKETMVLFIIQGLKSFKHLQDSLFQKTEKDSTWQDRSDPTAKQSYRTLSNGPERTL